MKNSRKIEVLKMVAADMENDAKNFDGQPFTGKTVAEYFGNQGAAISALANIMKLILEQTEKEVRTMKDNWKVYQDKALEWRWRRSASNGEIVGASTEGYKEKADCVINATRNGMFKDEDAAIFDLPDEAA